MRSLLLLVWLILPILAGAYHYGPGQDRLVLDEASRILAEAGALAKDEEWSRAELKYDEALALLPLENETEIRRCRLERAKAQMQIKKLPEAHRDLKILVEDLRSDRGRDEGLFREAQEALASSQYYMTWLMRLEGRPDEDWEPEIESARQIYRHLAEQSEAKEPSSEESAKRREDLESAIRLARMELSELQGLPLPSQ